MSDAEEEQPVAEVEAEEPADEPAAEVEADEEAPAAAAPSEPMDVNTAVQVSSVAYMRIRVSTCLPCLPLRYRALAPLWPRSCTMRSTCP